LLLVSFMTAVACGQSEAPALPASATVLTIGYGLATGQTAEVGIQGLARSLALEPLVAAERDGRTGGRLAESWTTSKDGLTLRVQLRRGATFHDGKPVTASRVRDFLEERLPEHLGPVYQDIARISATADNQIEFTLRRRSTLLVEGLDPLVSQKDEPFVGTGPFVAGRPGGDQIEMAANANYDLGRPLISRLVLRPYGSVRSAWADLLRNQVDMLYEVGQDALDSLQPSSAVRVFTYQRPYVYVVFLNFQRPLMRDASFRRALNAAIDRRAIVADVLNGHGAAAEGPVWPSHWAYSSDLPTFKYEPRPIAAGSVRPRFTCIFADASFERLALTMQKQLEAIGVDVDFTFMPLDKAMEEVEAGNFDAFLADAGQGPNLIRPYMFWHSGSPLNWGQYSSQAVDGALDSIRDAADDAAYKAGVAAFQTAFIDDPPAIFLAWGERARAVSTRFELPSEPGWNILSSLRLWQPLDSRLTARRD
jgi:peptide/nickel transport system substrate-binding protein